MTHKKGFYCLHRFILVNPSMGVRFFMRNKKGSCCLNSSNCVHLLMDQVGTIIGDEGFMSMRF